VPRLVARDVRLHGWIDCAHAPRFIAIDLVVAEIGRAMMLSLALVRRAREKFREITLDPKMPIRSLDYTVIFARQMGAMREFYGATLGFPLHKDLGGKWIEYRVGSNLLALSEHGLLFDDPAPAIGVLSLQLAFRVTPGEVASCAAVLRERGVSIISGPTDQPFGHRTLFFRDPDGNVLEIYAEIEV
jgi:catechol 2,3-dioxygenase-like lactoylglutathione lyase family enzyme